MPGWTWVPKAARYRETDTGQWMKHERVLELVGESRQAGGEATTQYAGMVSEGRLSPNDWNGLMRKEIKEEYITQYTAGRGGRNAMTPSDWGRIGAMTKEQYKYLGEFQKDLPNLSEAQIAARSRMYMNSSIQGYESGRSVAVTIAGAVEELWVLGDTEHCDGCKDLAAMGWVPVGEHETFPGAGDTACLTNCACHMEYRDPVQEPVGR